MVTAASRPRPPRVVLISNDVVPGSAVPVAAPGLRAYGLAQGLRAHGVDAQVVVVKHIVSRVWADAVPMPRAAGTIVLETKRLQDYLAAHAPVVAIITNSNQIDHLRPAPGVAFVFDFFAPKVLELISEPSIDYPLDRVRRLRSRKLAALGLADAVIVNGAKKLPYALAWLLQTDRDVRRIPMEVVDMCVPASPARDARVSGPLRLGIAGYVQPWSVPGGWVSELGDVVSLADVTLDLLIPRHWGMQQPDQPSWGEGLLKLAERDNVHLRGMVTFDTYRRFIEGLDLVIDLFDENLERDYAMVTRTVVALACGVPVIHPPFTEVAPMIAEYDAGWLADPSDPRALHGIVSDLLADRSVLKTKTANAQRLAAERLDPQRAVVPLVHLVRELVTGLTLR